MNQCERAVPIHRIEFGVDWPPGHVAGYLVDCDEPVLIDAGMPGSDSEGLLRETLSEHGYELGDIEHLVLTHPHIDHIGQVTTIVERASPTVYAPSGVRERFDRDLAVLEETVRENATAAGFVDERLEQLVDRAVESLRRNRAFLPTETVDVWVDGGETVAIGDTLVDVLHTPGHQADHCCYLVDLNDERVLVSGDMAIEPFRPVVLHAGLDTGVENAIDGFYTALDRLGSLDVDRVYPGHGPVHTDFEQTIERDRNNLDQMLDRTVETVRDESEHDRNHSNTPKTAAEVATERAGSRDTTYIAAEVVASLSHLRNVERIEAVETDGVLRYQSR